MNSSHSVKSRSSVHMIFVHRFPEPPLSSVSLSSWSAAAVKLFRFNDLWIAEQLFLLKGFLLFWLTFSHLLLQRVVLLYNSLSLSRRNQWTAKRGKKPKCQKPDCNPFDCSSRPWIKISRANALFFPCYFVKRLNKKKDNDIFFV